MWTTFLPMSACLPVKYFLFRCGYSLVSKQRLSSMNQKHLFSHTFYSQKTPLILKFYTGLSTCLSPAEQVGRLEK